MIWLKQFRGRDIIKRAFWNFSLNALYEQCGGDKKLFLLIGKLYYQFLCNFILCDNRFTQFGRRESALLEI